MLGGGPQVHAAQVPARNYAISPSSLRNALDALAAQGDVEIVYAPELVAGKSTLGLRGRLTPEEALRQLLNGTGLTWKAVNESTFVLQYAPAPHHNLPPAKAVVARKDNMETPRTLEAFNVSGSLINNAQIQTATPTYSISAQMIAARGFNSVAEVLQNIALATGAVQGPQTAGSFTQGAQAVSLNGFGPGFTSILIDGKPIASFGRLYDGTNNFTSIANIPLAMVERIDVMPGGASSIYGSQAVAGVINIITRQHLDGVELSARAGGYTGGGGASQRLSMGYAHAFGKLDVLAMFEFDNTLPIWGYQRALTASTRSNPNGNSSPALQAGILDYGGLDDFTGRAHSYLEPPAGCATSLFGYSTMLTSAHGLPGSYCGSRDLVGYATYSNRSRSYDGMLKLRYHVDDHLRLYSDMLVDWQQQKWYSGVDSWYPDDLPDGAVEDASTGHILYPERLFAPEEMPGGASGQMARQNDLMYQFDVGANGQFGDSDWDWDIYYLRSADRTHVIEPLRITSRVDSFFDSILQPNGEVDPDTGFSLYRPNYRAFFAPISPAQYASFTRNVDEFSKTWINDTRATVSNTHLFPLPGGDAALAVLAEGGSEAWYEPLNPLFAQGDVFEHAMTGGGGQRSHGASAFELNLPLLRPLTLDLSGRYDYYSSRDTASNSKFTYKVGLEYRPWESVLLRGNYTTAFKAPDLSALYLGPSNYFTEVTDYYRCAQADNRNCGRFSSDVMGQSRANRDLQPTTAQSWSAGAVWSPDDAFGLSADYLHTAVKDEVIAQDIDLLVHNDARCLLGELNGESALCQSLTNAVTGQVQRAGDDTPSAIARGPITGITTYYANLANEVVDSIVATARYRFAHTTAGVFDAQLTYSDILKHSYQLAPGQMPIDRLSNPLYNAGFKSVVSGTVGWTSTNGHWKSTLYGRRFGSTPNYRAENDGADTNGASRLHPWITFNWTFDYAPAEQFDVALIVNNIADKMPPMDRTYTVYPYYDVDAYNVYGRQVMLQATYRFGMH